MKPLIYAVLCCAISACATNLATAAADNGECKWRDSLDQISGTKFLSDIPKIEYEGPASKNPFAFHYYNKTEVIMGKPMHEWLRFSMAFWHTMRGDGSDPFGSATKAWPWEEHGMDSMTAAATRLHVFFELLDILSIDYWCFHDRDIAPEGATLKESNDNLDAMVEIAQQLQRAANKRVLWGTAQLFKHPRYMHGAATSNDASVFAYAAAQVKKALEVTHQLGGENYVFWGGREGYQTLLNTDLKLELDNQARFLKLARDHARKIGFKGPLLLEPKPQEPTKHQYDWDAAAAILFLTRHGLQNDFALNIECNHALLSKHTCEHELEFARVHGALGSIDANVGDAVVGWDTDEFMSDARQATMVMLSVLRNGGLAPGGFNFDAKLRRESIDVKDLVLAHVSGMDTLARGLRAAAALLEHSMLDSMRDARYSSWHSGLGKNILNDKMDMAALEEYALQNEDPVADVRSGQQELFERVVAMYV